VGDQPRAQVGGRLPDLVLVKGLVGDCDLSGDHRAQHRGAAAARQPADDGRRVGVAVQRVQERRELRDGGWVAFGAQSVKRVAQRAGRAQSPRASRLLGVPQCAQLEIGNLVPAQCEHSGAPSTHAAGSCARWHCLQRGRPRAA